MQTYPAVNRKNLVFNISKSYSSSSVLSRSQGNLQGTPVCERCSPKSPHKLWPGEEALLGLCRTKFCCGIVAKEAWGWGDPPARTEFLLFSGTSWKSWDTDPRGTVCLVLFGCTQGCLPNSLLSLLENVAPPKAGFSKIPQMNGDF